MSLVDHTASNKDFMRSLKRPPAGLANRDFEGRAQEYLSKWSNEGWSGSGAGTMLLDHFTSPLTLGTEVPTELRPDLCKRHLQLLGTEETLEDRVNKQTEGTVHTLMLDHPSMAVKYALAVMSFRAYSEWKKQSESSKDSARLQPNDESSTKTDSGAVTTQSGGTMDDSVVFVPENDVDDALSQLTLEADDDDYGEAKLRA